MSTLVSKNVQIGADGTASNNFTIYQPASPDGTLRIGNGNTGTTSAQVVLTSAGNVGIGTSPATKLNVAGDGETLRFTPASGTASTAATFGTFRNGGGIFYFGMDSSTGGSFGSAYGSVLWGSGAYPMIFATSNTERMRIDSSGNLLVGITSGSNKLLVNDPVNRDLSTAQVMIVGNGYQARHWLDGTAYYIGQDSTLREVRVFSGSSPTTGVKLTNGATSWASTSDEREKDIIEPISDAVGKLSGVRTVIGKYKTDGAGTRRSFLIAQDVEAVFPEAVSEDESGILSLRYTDLIPVLVKAIQEQQAIIEQLKARLDAANL